MGALILSLLMLLSDAQSTPDLTGKVVGPNNQPMADATVMVYSASPKKGAATANESDYPDCQKSARTDAVGGFKIAGVDPSLKYQLLILADDFRPLAMSNVDPLNGDITAKLKSIPANLDADHMIKGHVVDDAGNPIAGARIEPYGAQDGDRRWWGTTDGVCESETYTDSKGRFTFLTKKPDIRVDLRVFARHLAPINCDLVPTGDADHEISLTAGATLTGRLLKNETPLAGVRMCLVQQDRGCEHYITDFHAFTDADGKFAFANVHPSDNYYLYGTMKSLSPYGVISIRSCNVNTDGSTTDAGDLTVESGNTVSGKIFCSDGKPLPQSAKIHLTRWETGGDSLDQTVGADGKFMFANFPSEMSEFWVDVPGYHLSDQNLSYEPMNAIFLLGKVDGDIDDLRIQLDPDPKPQRKPGDSGKWQMLQNTRLTGMQE